MIAVIDYGMGNLRSVSKAFEQFGAEVCVTNRISDIEKSGAIVLPGVGAFRKAMDNLSRLNILSYIRREVKYGKPFLGICLGMQLFFSESEEHGVNKGFDLIKGRVRRFDPSLKVPHMGWNQVKVQGRPSGIRIFKGIPAGAYFYFVHSYYADPEDKDVIIGRTEYGSEFVSAINKDNIWGVQFHPEKSSLPGLKVLDNFCRYVS